MIANAFVHGGVQGHKAARLIMAEPGSRDGMLCEDILAKLTDARSFEPHFT